MAKGAIPPWLRDEWDLERGGISSNPGCHMETFASKEIPKAPVPITYQKGACPKNHSGLGPASVTNLPGDHGPVFPDVQL